MKLQLGQLFIVTGPHHYEKAEVIGIDKKVYTLDNGIKINRHLEPLNSRLTIEPFDQDKWDLLVAKGNLPKLISKLSSIKVPDEKVIMVYNKLNKLISKLE